MTQLLLKGNQSRSSNSLGPSNVHLICFIFLLLNSLFTGLSCELGQTASFFKLKVVKLTQDIFQNAFSALERIILSNLAQELLLLVDHFYACIHLLS